MSSKQLQSNPSQSNIIPKAIIPSKKQLIQLSQKEIINNPSQHVLSSKLLKQEVKVDQKSEMLQNKKLIEIKIKQQKSIPQIKQHKHQQSRVKNNSQLQKSTQTVMIESKLTQFQHLSYQDVDLVNYFSQFHTKQKQNQTKHKVQNYQQNILNNIKKQLTKGKLNIQKAKPFSIKLKQKNEPLQSQEMKQRLQIQKQEALIRLQDIHKQQLQLRRRAVSTYQSSPHKSVVIHHLPQAQQQKQLTLAIKQYRKFTTLIQKRDQQVKLQKQQKKLQQLQKKQYQLQRRREQKRKQVKQNLKQLIQRQQKRKNIIQESKNKSKQIKNKRYLHIQFKHKELEQQNQINNQKILYLERLKQNHKFDKQIIEQHQRNYKESLEQRKQLIKSASASRMTERSYNKKYQSSKFQKLALKQLQEIKKRQIQKIMKVKQNQVKQKMHKYQEKVDMEIKPKLILKPFVPLPRCLSMDALAPLEQRELGLKYLQKAKKLKKTVDEVKFQQLKKDSQQRLKLSKSKNSYKDYLKQIKKDIQYDPAQKKLQQILNKKRANSDYKSLKDAKYLSEYLVEKSKNSNQNKTMLAIQKKMDILNSIY